MGYRVCYGRARLGSCRQHRVGGGHAIWVRLVGVHRVEGGCCGVYVFGGVGVWLWWCDG